MLNTGNSGPLQLLLVEDNLGDIYLLKESFSITGSEINIIEARDGITAFGLLFPEKEEDRIEPDLVMLDLNVPARSGKEIIKKIRENESTRDLQIVIWTSAENPEDKEYCRQYGVEEFFIKPQGFDELCELAEKIIKLMKSNRTSI